MQMLLVDAPSMRPHVCVDGSQTGPLVDTQLTHPTYGRMYWPRRLVLEAARLYGFVAPDEHMEATETVKTLRARVLELEGELAELQPVRDALRGAAARFSDEEAAVVKSSRPPRKRAA